MLLGTSGSLLAAPVTLFFSGTIDVDDEHHMLPSDIADGDTFFGTLTYHLDAAVGDTPFEFSRYWTGPTGLSLFVKGHAFRPDAESSTSVYGSDDAGPLDVSPEFNPPAGDSFYAHTYLTTGIDGRDLRTLALAVVDPAGSAFSIDHLDQGISFSPGQQISMEFKGVSMIVSPVEPPFHSTTPHHFVIRGRVDNLFTMTPEAAAQLASVPEPSALALAGAGLAATAVVLLRRRAACSA